MNKTLMIFFNFVPHKNEKFQDFNGYLYLRLMWWRQQKVFTFDLFFTSLDYDQNEQDFFSVPADTLCLVMNGNRLLNTNSCPVPDEICPKIINKLYSYPVKPLKWIFNLPLTTGIEPQSWKITSRTLLFTGNLSLR